MSFEYRLEQNLRKTKWKTIENWIVYITKHMFAMIDVESEYSKEFVKTEKWYEKYQWTLSQQKEYQHWLVNDIRSMKISKKYAEHFARQFVFNYGWKLAKQLIED